ncbi:MAG: hypothetical protein WC906_03970 [Parcubacteria group bacterium]|jgi:uncharacterized membrane protein
MKNKIKQLASIVSVAILTAPALVLAQTDGSSSGFFDSSAGGGTGLPTGSIMGIVTNLMNWLLIIIGIVGVIGFAIAGILYLTAAGDEDRIKTAKSAMIYSIIGVIVAILGVVILKAAASFLGGTGQNF